MSPFLKLALDLGPLLVFFVANSLLGIYGATAAFMVAAIAAIGLGFAVERKISPMPVITAVVVLVFGGLTLWLANDVFIKIKPTILYTIFAAVLLGGLVTGRLYIKNLLGESMRLPDHAWRVLTWRWAAFFLTMAVLNEFVRRSVSTDHWVAFKVWGIFPLTLLFAFAQTPYLMRHQIETDEEKNDK